MWGKVWLFYGSIENGSQVTRSEDTYTVPLLTPAKDKFLCMNYRGQLIVYDTLDNTLRNLGRGVWPSWSSDGQFVAFCKTEESHYDIESFDLWVAKYDGSFRRQITNTPDVLETYCSFSPTSRRLLYISDRDGKILVIDLKEGEE